MSGMVFPSTASERVMRAAIERVGSDDVVAVINGEVGVGTTTTVDSDHTLPLSFVSVFSSLSRPWLGGEKAGTFVQSERIGGGVRVRHLTESDFGRRFFFGRGGGKKQVMTMTMMTMPR